jgi:hypothetical protein
MVADTGGISVSATIESGYSLPVHWVQLGVGASPPRINFMQKEEIRWAPPDEGEPRAWIRTKSENGGIRSSIRPQGCRRVGGPVVWYGPCRPPSVSFPPPCRLASHVL